jgi:hypothetical protein
MKKDNNQEEEKPICICKKLRGKIGVNYCGIHGHDCARQGC